VTCRTHIIKKFFFDINYASHHKMWKYLALSFSSATLVVDQVVVLKAIWTVVDVADFLAWDDD